ncbi:hypothetical protein AEM42_02735 [Betaproteobacteria bacterium UKL13-2]|nr:hypothetical protein AEM42_02735 [Betaproteobacteria bacterium UKL13-2]HCG53480.1 hypothetical protein [Betaproteobacteria bacterium]
MLREEGRKFPSNRPRANVQPTATAKEEPAKLVFQSLRGNVLRHSGRPMKYSGEMFGVEEVESTSNE